MNRKTQISVGDIIGNFDAVTTKGRKATRGMDFKIHKTSAPGASLCASPGDGTGGGQGTTFSYKEWNKK